MRRSTDRILTTHAGSLRRLDGTWATYAHGRLSGFEGGTLPDGKGVIRGAVTRKTNVLEHPEVVAERIVRHAKAVGRENVVAGSDCGFGGRLHPQLVRAKLRTLAEGVELASRRLWH